MAELNNNAFNARIRELVAMPEGSARERELSEVFRELMDTGTLRRWAGSIAKHSNYRDMDGMDDIAQVISEKILLTLRQAAPESTSRIGDWVKFLHGVGVRGVKTYLASSQVNLAAGMAGVTRRRAIIARTRKELVTEYHREPTNAEIITRANAWALSHHKDAQKQGLLLSDKDFKGEGMTAVSLDESPTVAPAMMNEADTYSEAMLAMRRLRATAKKMFPEDADLHSVLVAWADCAAAGERPTQPLMVKMTGLKQTAVRSAMVRLNDVLEQMRDQFGEED